MWGRQFEMYSKYVIRSVNKLPYHLLSFNGTALSIIPTGVVLISQHTSHLVE